MTERITPELFDHLIELAALELDSQEAEYLLQELNNQLRAIHELESIPLVSNTPITSHGVPYPPESRPALRTDHWISCPNPEEIVAQAPQTDDSYIVVPDIPHTELE